MSFCSSFSNQILIHCITNGYLLSSTTLSFVPDEGLVSPQRVPLQSPMRRTFVPNGKIRNFRILSDLIIIDRKDGLNMVFVMNGYNNNLNKLIISFG